MTDFYEIDFLSVQSDKSGDAITMRYQKNGGRYIHVVDAGFQSTGEKVVAHIEQYYDSSNYIDHVVATHPDGDHAGGLRSVLEHFSVGNLWMLRPWLYAGELIHRFTRFSSVENLAARLRELYPNLDALEKIALEKNIPIQEPFQGQDIGAFVVLAPTKSRYLDMVVESDKTPESKVEKSDSGILSFTEFVSEKMSEAVAFVRGFWGEEIFSSQETSPENEMSIVQGAVLCERRILLTADSGRSGLNEAADYAPIAGIHLPGLEVVQVPHHGSRRNVDSDVLDRLLGTKYASQQPDGSEKTSAFVSASEKDKDHPRKAVVRAFIHRGAKVISTETAGIRSHYNAPAREGWSAAPALPYPNDQEEW